MQKFPAGCSGWADGGMADCAEAAGKFEGVATAGVTGVAITPGAAEAGASF